MNKVGISLLKTNIENGALLRIASDDEKAFKEIFERYKRLFHAAAFKMTRSADNAEEIVQEVFIKLWVMGKKSF